MKGALWVGELYTSEPPTGFLGWHIVRYVARSFFRGDVEGVGPLITALAVAGFLLLLWRRSRAAVMVWLPALLYLLAYSSVLRNPYERNFMPLLPHLAIASAVAVVAFGRAAEALAQRRWPRVRRRQARLSGLVLGAVETPAGESGQSAATASDSPPAGSAAGQSLGPSRPANAATW